MRPSVVIVHILTHFSFVLRLLFALYGEELILGFPVGFVGAAESKDALADHSYGIPFLAIRGRRGGSAMAAAAVNALASDVE